MRVFLDDVRPMPDGFDVVVRNSRDCIELLATGKVTHISFDHDLGGRDTGYKVAAWIEEAVYYNEIELPTWEIHSANPVGASRIAMAMGKRL